MVGEGLPGGLPCHWPSVPYVADNTGPLQLLHSLSLALGEGANTCPRLNPHWLFYATPELRMASTFVKVWKENQMKSNILRPVNILWN